MSETAKITMDELKGIMQDVYMPTSEMNWNGLNLVIRRNISFQEMIEFVRYVTDLCFDEETNEYIPEVRDFAIKTFLIEHYTNIELPEKLEDKAKLIYETDVIQNILGNVDPQQFNEIVHAIDVKLDYLSEANIEAINKRMNELYDAFENLEKQLSSVFGGISEESMVDLVEAIKDGRLDEGKLVESYFEKKGVN